MKKFIVLFFAVVSTMSATSQTYIQDGDRCFANGDYDCSVTHYDNAFKNANGKDRQIAEIKLTRAKWCAEHIKNADQAFSVKNYKTAKEEYQKVLDSNPKDNYAQSQIGKCDNALNPPKLRKATAAELADIRNNKYGVQPQRRQNLIKAGIDPDDAQTRINAGEGITQEKEKQATNLTVSKTTLYFSYNGGTSERIKVHSDAGTYSVPSGYIPLWCIVKTYKNYFKVTVFSNPTYTSRKAWFKITAGDEEVRINIEQSARTGSESQQSSSPKKTASSGNANECFNCPKTHDTWGLTLGYRQQTFDYYYNMDVIQFGLKSEPLFKYGFGINTGINFLGYTENISDFEFFDNGFNAYAVNIPLHLEYRLNFSKWFNIFVYGGVGLNALTNPNFDVYSLPVTYEYGGGLRINHIQFNAGKSLYLGNLSDSQYFGNYSDTYQELILSVSLMF